MARDELGDEYLEKRFQYVKNHLDDADVIVTTCTGALSSWLEKREFWHILIDEATQSTGKREHQKPTKGKSAIKKATSIQKT